MARKAQCNKSDHKVPSRKPPARKLQAKERDSTIPFPPTKEPQTNSPDAQAQESMPSAIESQANKANPEIPVPRRPVTRAQSRKADNNILESQTQVTDAQANNAGPEIPVSMPPVARKRRRQADPCAPRKKRNDARTAYTCDICCEDKPKAAFIRYVKVQPDSHAVYYDRGLEVPAGCFTHLAKRPGPNAKNPVCRDCITQSLSTKLETLGPDSLHFGCCGDADCRNIWHADHFRKFLTVEDMEAYNLWLFEMWRRKMQQRGHLIECTNESCNAVGLVEPHRISPGLPQVECSECKTRMCADCRAPWHKGETCTEFRLKDLPDKLERGEKQVIASYKEKADVKRCPHCLMVVEKIDGCDGMICPVCTKFFDWKNGMPLEVETRTEPLEYEHGGALGCEADMSPEERQAARVSKKEWIDPALMQRQLHVLLRRLHEH